MSNSSLKILIANIYYIKYQIELKYKQQVYKVFHNLN